MRSQVDLPHAKSRSLFRQPHTLRAFLEFFEHRVFLRGVQSRTNQSPGLAVNVIDAGRATAPFNLARFGHDAEIYAIGFAGGEGVIDAFRQQTPVVGEDYLPNLVYVRPSDGVRDAFHGGPTLRSRNQASDQVHFPNAEPSRFFGHTNALDVFAEFVE